MIHWLYDKIEEAIVNIANKLKVKRCDHKYVKWYNAKKELYELKCKKCGDTKPY